VFASTMAGPSGLDFYFEIQIQIQIQNILVTLEQRVQPGHLSRQNRQTLEGIRLPGTAKSNFFEPRLSSNMLDKVLAVASSRALQRRQRAGPRERTPRDNSHRATSRKKNVTVFNHSMLTTPDSNCGTLFLILADSNCGTVP
jgi:hypothetical protein